VEPMRGRHCRYPRDVAIGRATTFLLHAIACALVLVGAGSLVTGCGGSNGSSETSAEGARLFSESGCGDCHSLTAAGARARVGPDLDALAPSFAVVAQQVREGGGGMPAFSGQLSENDIAEIASFVATATGGSTDPTEAATAAEFTPDDTKLASCEGRFSCLEQGFGNLAYEDGPKAALDKLAEMQNDPVVAGACHPIAHKIGAGGLLHFDGEVGPAFVAGNGTCGSGYYHGLLQWKLAGVSADQVGAAARTACNDEEIKANAFNYYQCDHGLGHGLMLYTGYDLPDALDYCHQLVTEFDQVACSGGVFMENQSSSFGLRTKWLKKDNLLYPCNSELVQRRDKLYCYLLVTSHILPNVNGDWKKTADWCRKSERGWAEICFQSYGRDVAGNAGRDPRGMKQLCAQAGSGEKDCIYGAIRDVMNNNPQDPQGKGFCEIVKAEFRAACFFGMGTILGTLHADVEGKRQACEQWAKDEDLTQCLQGAGAY
jgi:mono/diheme cytochrome c family protein